MSRQPQRPGRVAPPAAPPAAPVTPVTPVTSVNEAPAAPIPGQVEGTARPAGRPPMNKSSYRAEGASQLTEWPKDFDSKVHKPLQLEDFSAEDVFFNHKAALYERKAAYYRDQASMFLQFGSAEMRKCAEKYTKQMHALAELQAQLEEQGVDMNQLLANINQPGAAPDAA